MMGQRLSPSRRHHRPAVPDGAAPLETVVVERAAATVLRSLGAGGRMRHTSTVCEIALMHLAKEGQDWLGS